MCVYEIVYTLSASSTVIPMATISIMNDFLLDSKIVKI